MRSTFAAALLLVPLFVFVPTAHACAGPTPTVDGGSFYFIERSTTTGSIVEANQVGLGIDACDWRGIQTETWQETNGIAGLQTGGGCEPDTLVATTFITTGNGQCRL